MTPGPGRPGHTSAEVAASAGIGLADARRLWRALGFADAGDAAAFDDADLAAMRRIATLVGMGAVDFETAVRLTRAVGHTMGRLAAWQVATLSERIEETDGHSRATVGHRTSATELTGQLGPLFEQLMVYAWRRHLAASVARVEALWAADEDLHTAQVAVGFADLVSFTTVTHGLDDDALGDLVENFESKATDLIAGLGGRVIKALGDSVLFVTDTAADGVETALSVVDVIAADQALPDVKVGMASGPVVTRMGDVFGSCVNMASRLTAVARRNRVIIDQDTAARLPEGRFVLRALPPRPLRGFGPVEPIAVRRATGEAPP